MSMPCQAETEEYPAIFIHTAHPHLFSSTTNKLQCNTIYLFFVKWVCASQTYFQVQPTSCNVTQFIYFLWNALHVSGGSSAYHRELKTVYTASGTLSNLYCYLPPSWKSLPRQCQVAVKAWQSTRCCIYSFELLVMGGGTAWNM